MCIRDSSSAILSTLFPLSRSPASPPNSHQNVSFGLGPRMLHCLHCRSRSWMSTLISTSFSHSLDLLDIAFGTGHPTFGTGATCPFLLSHPEACVVVHLWEVSWHGQSDPTWRSFRLVHAHARAVASRMKTSFRFLWGLPFDPLRPHFPPISNPAFASLTGNFMTRVTTRV